jgi:hypothetical protein
MRIETFDELIESFGILKEVMNDARTIVLNKKRYNSKKLFEQILAESELYDVDKVLVDNCRNRLASVTKHIKFMKEIEAYDDDFISEVNERVNILNKITDEVEKIWHERLYVSNQDVHLMDIACKEYKENLDTLIDVMNNTPFNKPKIFEVSFEDSVSFV